MVNLDEFTYEEHPPRTKAELDVEVSDLTYDRRLAMAARRAADLFDYCSMFSTASTAFLEAETE